MSSSSRFVRPTGGDLQYGYLFWTGTVDHDRQKLPWAAGFGNGGQRIYVVPALDLTIIMTAGAYNQGHIREVTAALFGQIVAATNVNDLGSR